MTNQSGASVGTPVTFTYDESGYLISQTGSYSANSCCSYYVGSNGSNVYLDANPPSNPNTFIPTVSVPQIGSIEGFPSAPNSQMGSSSVFGSPGLPNWYD